MKNGRVLIGDVAEVNPRSVAKGKVQPDELVSFVPMAAVSEKTLSIEERIDRPYGEVSKGFTAFRRGDILVAKITPCFENGKMAYAADLPYDHGFGSTEFHVLRPNKELDGSYLFHLLRAPIVRKAGEMKMKGAAGQRRVPAEFFAGLQIPLPPLPEQRRIAAILDAADALRARRREALAQLDTLLQATFLEMFGDPVENPMGWGIGHLPDFVADERHALKRGPFGGALKKDIFVARGFKVFEQKNAIYNDFELGEYFISDHDYSRLKAFRICPGDLIVSCSGTIGRIAEVPDTAPAGVMNQALLKIRLDESQMLNPFFIALWRSVPFEREVLGMTHGTGMKNMKSMSELKTIDFIRPPLPLQHRFASIVESVERQKARMRAHLAELDALFASLQSRAFRGEL